MPSAFSSASGLAYAAYSRWMPILDRGPEDLVRTLMWCEGLISFDEAAAHDLNIDCLALAAAGMFDQDRAAGMDLQRPRVSRTMRSVR
jgi:hypothetical protein